MLEIDDVLEFFGFWLIVRFFFSNFINDSFILIFEYKVYQDLVVEMDFVIFCISVLIKVFKFKGFYVKENLEVECLFCVYYLEMIFVEDYYGFVDKGGIEGVFFFMLLGQIIEVLNQFYVNCDQFK